MYFMVLNISDDVLVPNPIIGREDVSKITNRKELPDTVFHDQESAVQEAQQKATQNPTKDFAVLQSILVFSTGKPKIITKEFNEHGELIEKKEKANV
jgi:hypothetical protein